MFPHFVLPRYLQIKPHILKQNLGSLHWCNSRQIATRHQLKHSSTHSNFGSNLTRKFLASSSVTSLHWEHIGEKNQINDCCRKWERYDWLENKPGKSIRVRNLSIASVFEIKVSSLDARNSQKLLRAFSWQNIHRVRRKSLNCFGSCRGQTFWG